MAAPFALAGVADVAVIGGGLAGGLVALALAERGQRVTLVDSGKDRATGFSYGGVLGEAVGAWRQLELLHGDLGLRPCRLSRHGLPPWGAWQLPWRHEPCARVDGLVFQRALPLALLAAGVGRISGEIRGEIPGQIKGSLQAPSAGSPWQLPFGVAAHQVVLAAGAHCRDLWPALPDRLRSSWAGVLQLERWVGRAQLLLPQYGVRWELEARAGELSAAEWVVDPSMAPWGAGGLLGQISWISPTGALAPPPDPTVMEARLRRGLAAFDPALAMLPGRFQQVPVAFCIGAEPMVGPVADAPGLWTFTGFSGAFSQVPLLAQQLAARLNSCSEPC